MSLPAIVMSAAVVAAQPAGTENRTPVRCPPAPYYIMDKEEPPVADRQPEPSRPTRLGLSEKRPRPCYLTRRHETRVAYRLQLI